MSSHSDARTRLRKELRARRRALPVDERRSADRAAQMRVMAHRSFVNSRQVALYRAYDGETDTSLIAETAKALSKRVLFARSRVGKPLEFVEPETWGETGQGLPVPKGQGHELSNTDVIIVPAIAFDHEGYRLGFGGGHYDRTLAVTEAWPMGLCYDVQIVPRLEHQEWDQPVFSLATECDAYEFEHGEYLRTWST